MSKIPGTRVDDNALHRASLWLAAFQGTQEGGPVAYSREEEAAEHDRLADECHVDGLTGADIQEGADFYSVNFAVMMLGSAARVVVVGPTGTLDLLAMIRVVWIDGLRHGIATRDGKRGLSNTEIAGQ